MATQEGTRLKRQVSNGEYGKVNIEHSSFTAAATPVADVIRFIELPAGAQVLNVKAVFDAMGASSTLSLGYEYVNPDDGSASAAGFKAATSTVSAGTFSSDAHPLPVFTAPVYITATVGGGAITGKVSLFVTYEQIGTM